jgi:hypothetical protein
MEGKETGTYSGYRNSGELVGAGSPLGALFHSLKVLEAGAGEARTAQGRWPEVSTAVRGAHSSTNRNLCASVDPGVQTHLPSSNLAA